MNYMSLYGSIFKFFLFYKFYIVYMVLSHTIKLKEHHIKKNVGATSGFKTENIVQPENALCFLCNWMMGLYKKTNILRR